MEEPSKYLLSHQLLFDGKGAQEKGVHGAAGKGTCNPADWKKGAPPHTTAPAALVKALQGAGSCPGPPGAVAVLVRDKRSKCQFSPPKKDCASKYVLHMQEIHFQRSRTDICMCFILTTVVQPWEWGLSSKIWDFDFKLSDDYVKWLHFDGKKQIK